MAQTVKNLPAVKETWIQFLGREDPLEKGTATHSSILAWKIPWTEEPGGLQSQRIGHDWATKHIPHIQCPCMSLYIIKAELHGSLVPRDDPQLWWVLAVAQEELGCCWPPVLREQPCPWLTMPLTICLKVWIAVDFTLKLWFQHRTERRIPDCLATSPYACASGAKEGVCPVPSCGKVLAEGVLLLRPLTPLCTLFRKAGESQSYSEEPETLSFTAPVSSPTRLMLPLQPLDQGRWVVGDANRFPSLPGGRLYQGHCLELPVHDDNKKQRTFAQRH